VAWASATLGAFSGGEAALVPATFSIFFVWEAGASPDKAAAFVEALAESVPGEKARIRVALRPELATLLLDLDFSLYARATLSELEKKAQLAGGRLIELIRIPESQREEFQQRFLLPVEGEPLTCDSFRAAAGAMRSHLEGAPTSASSAGQARSDASAPAPPPAKPRGVEARTAPRYEVFLGVEFKTEAEFAHEYATNISKGGLFLRTEKRPALNSEALLTLHLPSGESLKTVARVVHVSELPPPGGVGVSFNPGDTAFEAALKKYLSSISKEAPPAGSQDTEKK
jgi:uncharacterized protein (TIGR02266 family)